MEKLRDIIRTSFITNDHISSLVHICEEHKELDLTGCKFWPEAAKIISKYYGNVTFTHSTDVEIAKILEHNQEAKTKYSQILDSTPLPVKFNSPNDVLRFIKTINKDRVYSLEGCNVAKLKCLSLAIIVAMRHPEVVLDLKTFGIDLFKQVRLDWLKYRDHWDKYIEVVAGGAVVEREVKDGKVYYPGFGNIEEDIYVLEYNVLPAAFGSEALNKHPQFKEVWENAARNLQENIEQVKTMKDYIELVEQ